MLTNVIWGLSSLERSFQVLEADAKRAERVVNDGAPAVVGLLTGQYGTDSLTYLMATGLRMDLGDALTAYRTLADPRRKWCSRGRGRRGRTAERPSTLPRAAICGNLYSR